ncbi:hypothetical protein PHYSODRAFT_338093 [Phytophthora sojae]|uniref:Uncharacterized protein n=1 Tax=Phytophthora sojae (strain P6497) TaxID=1094619 RepID=G5A0P4_PHYSP|nr:hypothetical protein PHYSODRAFT_338093 [Phytophthora sojae]EGZ11380.1 hypothetical protein PHYSODRAFT_338093 [Phytophthora sojae]|eukprot:XP_009534125.1 hypothetical protein PHYSODRAFT_338093 [Phytophthora sojae]
MPKTHEEAENAAAEAARTAVGDGDYMQGWIDRMDMLLGVTPESAAADAAECATEEQREAAELAWLASTEYVESAVARRAAGRASVDDEEVMYEATHTMTKEMIAQEAFAEAGQGNKPEECNQNVELRELEQHATEVRAIKKQQAAEVMGINQEHAAENKRLADEIHEANKLLRFLATDYDSKHIFRSAQVLSSEFGLLHHCKATSKFGAQATLMQALLEDEQFLRQLKTKLGLSSTSRPTVRAGKRSLIFEDEEVDENDARQVDLNDEIAAVMGEGMVAEMASSSFNCCSRPERKPPSMPIAVAAHTEGPRSSFINQASQATPVGMLDPADCSPYEPPEFIPELRAHFVPRPAEDLQEKKMQWAEFLRAQKAAGTPSAVIQRGAVAKNESEVADDMFEPDPSQQSETKEQREAPALLCARNNNLEGLELALDRGVDVNMRDNHGNTLFILDDADAAADANKPSRRPPYSPATASSPPCAH